MKNQVQTLEKRLVGINRNIEEDIKTIHILQAEWSHLNSPARLRKLAGKHIMLKPVQAEQIINYSQVPFEYEQNDSSKKRLARKNISTEQENKLIAKIQTDGIDFSLLEYF